MNFEKISGNISIGITALGLFAALGCSSTQEPGVDSNTAGSVSQALNCQAYYLQTRGSNALNQYARVDPGSATTRTGSIVFDKPTTTGATTFIKEAAGTGKFKFQVASGAQAGKYWIKGKTRLMGNGTYAATYAENTSGCTSGYVSWVDQGSNLGVSVQSGDAMLNNMSGNGCGTSNNEFKWVAASTITCPAAATTSTNTNAPATYFDLSKWKITLPVDKFNEGAPTDIYEYELPNWYDSSFFFTDASQRAVFKAPNEGLTTAGSENARSELRQMLRAGNTAITNMADPRNNWSIQSNLTGYTFAQIGGKLSATLHVDHVADSGCDPAHYSSFAVVIGQIHSNDDPNFAGANQGGFGNEPLKILYKKYPGHTKGSVYWTYQNNWAKGDPDRTTTYNSVWGNVPPNDATDPGTAGVALGEDFSYVVNVVGDTMNLTFTRAGAATKTFSQSLSVPANGTDNPDGWKYDSFYFKAGAYNQGNTLNDGTTASATCDGAGQPIATQYANGDYAQATFSSITQGPGGTTTAVCGNSVVESPEQCDDGNTVTEACTYGLTSCTVCSATCTSVAGAVKRCGDSIVQTANGEQCDDGNTTNTDACSNTCKTPTCTDGIKNGTETNTDCGGVSGGVTCAACVAPVCGNGVTQSPETCDDGNTVTETCPTYGGSCTNVCSATCQLVTVLGPRCGDGTPQSANGEQCDDGNTIDTDACRNTCKLPTCTDGIKDGTETGIDCGGSCTACPTGTGTTYQAENMTIGGSGGGIGTGTDAGWVWLEDGAPASITKTGSVAGSSVTVRYKNTDTTTGKLSLYVNGVLKAQLAAPSNVAADLVFSYAVPAGATVKIQTNGAIGFLIDYIKINP